MQAKGQGVRRTVPASDAEYLSSHTLPLQQKFHKRLPGRLQKFLVDIDTAAVGHTEGGIPKISGVL